MKTSELFGKEVLDVEANRIGKVVDIDFDVAQGTVSNLLVKAGLTKKYLIPLASIDKVGDKVILRVKGSEIK